MSDKKLSINLNNLIRDAFFAIPDFTDPEGLHISGVYGAFFRLREETSSGDYETLEILLNESQTEPAVIAGQVSKAKELFQGFEGFDFGKEIGIDDNLKAFINDTLLCLSPSGKAADLPKFRHALTVTSDLNEVEDIFKKAAEYGAKSNLNFVAFYPATDSKEGTLKGRKLLGLSLCFDESNAYYIPAEGFISEDYLSRKLAELSETASLSTFDIKECYRFFTPSEITKRTEGYIDDDAYKTEPRCFDVLIGAYINNPLKNDYEPWDISAEFVGIPLPKKSDVFGKTKLSEADAAVVSDYMGKIAFVCYKAAPKISERLNKSDMDKLFYNIEMPLSYILYAMEKEGIIAKKDALKEYGDRLTGRITELEKSIYEAAGCEFNINSPKQLGEILFERLGLPAEKKTKSGYSTAADVLEKLAPEHKIVADILEYRGLAKLKSTYADGLAAFIEDDDRIHTSFNQTITATGRISSTEPNLQNIPMRTELGRLIRKVFVPKEGCVFADADYSQIELRILAHMSEDQGLISAYHEGDDIHRITASKVFHVPFEDVTPLQRRNAKAVNFGIVYGISSFGLSQDLSISVSEAKDYMEKYFETYPGVRTYQNKVIQDAKNKGYSVTMFGRRRPIPELKASNFMMRQFGERVAMNAPIQGTAADIMKIAMLNVFFRIKRENLRSRLILQIHDELVIEAYNEEVEQVRDILEKEMERAVTLSVPMEVDCHTGNDWYEAK
jgi:DNA polymerase-1